MKPKYYFTFYNVIYAPLTTFWVTFKNKNITYQTVLFHMFQTFKISKTPLWSRRRPQLSNINERTEATTSLCNSFANVNKKKGTN